MRKLTIRDEQPSDIPAIHALTRAAFAKAAVSDGNEQDIVDALRSDGDLALSLVATNMDEAIIGHIAFSPVSISDGAKEGIARMLAMNAKGIVLLGDPGYYERFGFAYDPDLTLPGVPPAYFQARALSDDPRPKGTVEYAPGFSVQPKG